MAKADQIIVGFSMENGVPRVRTLTTKEQRRFFKTHPKLKLATVTLEEIKRAVESLEKITGMTDPSTISVVNELHPM